MKVILSRKGFDSANGGISSPIFQDGSMLSFPIPSRDKNEEKMDIIQYADLKYKNISLLKLLKDLGYKGDKMCCHLDPDIVKERRKEDIKGWKPAFGQINQASKYLLNQKIAADDLFLFFGNFRHVVEENGKYRYVRRTKETTDPFFGKKIQVIWGYLQIGEIIKNPKQQEALYWHPHACKERINGNNNLIFTPRDKFSFDSDIPGYGVLPFDKKRILTMEGMTKATWKEIEAYNTNNIESKRKNLAKGKEGIYYAGIWQELVLKDNLVSEKWAIDMLR